MANRIVEDIALFEIKCRNLHDVAKAFDCYSSSVLNRFVDLPLNVLLETISTWFVLFCALTDECTYLLSGDITSPRHRADKAKFQHNRVASRERYMGEWQSRCSADGIEYEVRQLPVHEQTKPRLENKMTSFDGIYSDFKHNVFECIKNQFERLKTSIIGLGATDYAATLELGIERLSFSLQKENKVLRCQIMRDNIIRKMSMRSIMDVIQPRRRLKRVIDDDDSEDGDEGNAIKVGKAVQKCSKKSIIESCAGWDDEEVMVESLDDLKRIYKVDPTFLRMSRQGAEMESTLKHPMLAHERGNAREQQKIDEERAQFLASTTSANSQFTADQAAFDGSLLAAEEEKAMLAHQKRGNSFAESRSDAKGKSGIAGASNKQTTIFRTNSTNDKANGSMAATGGTGDYDGAPCSKIEQSWEEKVRRRVSASYLLLPPSTVEVSGRVKFKPLGSDVTSLLSFKVSIDVHLSLPNTTFLVDCIFEDVVYQLLHAAPTCYDNLALPSVLIIENGKGDRLHFHSGDCVMVETLRDASSSGRVEISCADTEPVRHAFEVIKQGWQMRDVSASLPNRCPTYWMLVWLSTYITQQMNSDYRSSFLDSDHSSIVLTIDPYDGVMTKSLLSKYMSSILTIVANIISYNKPPPRVVVRNCSNILSSDHLYSLLKCSSSLLFDSCAGLSSLVTIVCRQMVSSDSPAVLTDLTEVRFRHCTEDGSEVHRLLAYLLSSAIAPSLRLIEISHCITTVDELRRLATSLSTALSDKMAHRQHHLTIAIGGIDDILRIEPSSLNTLVDMNLENVTVEKILA